jgi:transposase-like protein
MSDSIPRKIGGILKERNLQDVCITTTVQSGIQGRTVPRGYFHVQDGKAVATEYGIGAETLRNWLKKYLQEYAADEQAGHLSLDGRAAVGAAGVHQARRPPVPSGLTRLSRGSDGGVCMQWLNVRPGMTVEWESTYQHWPGNRTDHCGLPGSVIPPPTLGLDAYGVGVSSASRSLPSSL